MLLYMKFTKFYEWEKRWFFGKQKIERAAGIRYCNLTVLQQNYQTGNMATQTASHISPL